MKSFFNKEKREVTGMYFMGFDYVVTLDSKGKITEKSIRNKKEPIIFLAVGQITFDLNREVLFFDKDGHFGADNKNIFPDVPSDTRPNPSQTHPNPDDFQMNPNASSNDPKSYPYGAQTPGQSLRHEAEHNVLEAQGIFNEYHTDMRAMEGIRDAWERWEKSGFTDNSGYYFVFSLPPEEGGGYILTKKTKPNNTIPNSS